MSQPTRLDSTSWRPDSKRRAAFAGALILALGIVPNALWRSYGFSGSVGFPLAYDTWTDYIPPPDSYHPILLVLNAVIVLAMATGGTLFAARCAEARLQVARRWRSLVASVPFVLSVMPWSPWTTRIQHLIPVFICLWLFLRPSPLPWLLAFLLYASMTLLAFPSAVLSSGGGSVWSEPAYLTFMALTWLAVWRCPSSMPGRGRHRAAVPPTRLPERRPASFDRRTPR